MGIFLRDLQLKGVADREISFPKKIGNIDISLFLEKCVLTLMLPKLTHIAAILPNMARQKIDEIEKICKKFWRQNKRPISEFWTALKISWIKRFTPSRSVWVTIKKEWLADLGLTGLLELFNVFC